MYSRVSQENYMLMKKKNRPKLPTFEEFTQKQFLGISIEEPLTPNNNKLSESFEVSIEVFGVSSEFEDPLEHYGFRADTLEDSKEYDPYYPNQMV